MDYFRLWETVQFDENTTNNKNRRFAPHGLDHYCSSRKSPPLRFKSRSEFGFEFFGPPSAACFFFVVCIFLLPSKKLRQARKLFTFYTYILRKFIQKRCATPREKARVQNVAKSIRTDSSKLEESRLRMIKGNALTRPFSTHGGGK